MKNITKKNFLFCLGFFIISLFFFTRGLETHGLEYRDDEIFYFKSTQEMLNQSNYFSPTYFGDDRFQKPILFYWLIILSYKIFGINWFAARFFSAIFASLTVCVSWLLAKRLFDKKTAHLSVFILITISLFYRHAKNAVPDMPMNFFIVWAIYLWTGLSAFKKEGKVNPSDQNSQKKNILFFVACALGFMLKGFAAFIVPFLTIIVFSIWQKNRKLISELNFKWGLVTAFFIITPWFFYMIHAHGEEYLKYMLLVETKNRLVNQGQAPSFFAALGNFGRHLLFYAQTIFSYFAPWSLYFFVALPIGVVRAFSLKIPNMERQSLRLILSWIFIVWGFFSFMYFTINHYMLVLTTPFAILVSYFFLQPFENPSWRNKVINIFQKYTILILLPIGFIAYLVVSFFWAGVSKTWLPLYLISFFIVWMAVLKQKDKIVAPLTMALFLFFVFSQSSLMGRAGLTSHSILQKFARTIHEKAPQDYLVCVGSHDIHEKAFQVYFDRKVHKLGVSWEQGTRENLKKFFNKDATIYCLITQKDYEKYKESSGLGDSNIVEEDYMLRKRIHLDKDFFKALVRFKTKKVHDFLMEKIILLRKVADA